MCKKLYSVLAELIAAKRMEEYFITTSFFAEKIDFDLHTYSRGKNLNQEMIQLTTEQIIITDYLAKETLSIKKYSISA